MPVSLRVEVPLSHAFSFGRTLLLPPTAFPQNCITAEDICRIALLAFST